MHKKNSRAYLEKTLVDLLTIAYEHMGSLAEASNKLNITDSSSEHDQNRAQLFSHTLTIINDIVHPAHQLSLEMFPDAKPFIDYCIRMQEQAIEKKLIAPNCGCYECGLKKN